MPIAGVNWLVDNTIAKMHENAVTSFPDPLNTTDRHVQFTFSSLRKRIRFHLGDRA